MKKSLMIFTSAIIMILLNFTVSFAQEALKPRPSPLELVTMKYDDTYIKITYGRPHKKGREVFGSLVPFGQVWRTGANEATEITITKPVKIGGKKLDAGTYTLFTVPEKKNWTIIFNSDLGQWGSYKYNQDFDALRIEAPSSKTSVVYEPFTIEFEQKENKVNLIMMWDRTKVTIPIEFLQN
jgi:hypothetical protein